MSSESSSLFSLARSKLHLSVGAKGDGSLHRWVLLKNSIIRSSPTSPNGGATLLSPDVNSVYSTDGEVEDEEEGGVDEETDSFMFPDAGKLLTSEDTTTNASEAQWLDSLLETLGEDEDEEYALNAHLSNLHVDDDDDPILSGFTSPAASSEDLASAAPFFAPPIAIPYPVPYPPVIRSFDSDPSLAQTLDPCGPQYVDALPYYDNFDEDLSVPDAIEDTSDDESDALTTPSMSHTSPSFGLIDRVSIRSSASTRPRSQPHVYIDSNDSYFYPFELDPLPFPEDHINTYNHVYQEC